LLAALLELPGRLRDVPLRPAVVVQIGVLCAGQAAGERTGEGERVPHADAAPL
jgi:hypothetical protein